MNSLPLLFRPMQIDDIDSVVEIERASFPTPRSAKLYRRELTMGRLGFYWVVCPDPSVEVQVAPLILGYGGYWLMDNDAHIVVIASHPEWRGRGIGQWLLVNMLSAARKQGAQQATLEVRINNVAAVGLYAKLGFEQVGRRKRYYRDTGEDALLYTLSGLDDGAVWRRLRQMKG